MTTRRAVVMDRLKSWALPIGVAVVAAGLGAASITGALADRDRKAQESAASQSAAATPNCEVADRNTLVPASGALFGVNLNMDAKPLSQYAADLGHKPAVSVSMTV
ncbi:hypothetical protein PV772_06660 [Pseudarthrobacter sp. CC12]|uniref:hypothetical protein n=1 Tax=Pseudarthrobacter sp. CC12 TaxID=3029193 RepID=UPI003267B255